MATNNQPAFMPSEKAVQKTNRRKDLPAFYVAEKKSDVLRSHLISREGYVFENENFANSNPKKFSHFIAVPMHVVSQYEVNDIDESTYMWELTKMTADQLRKLLSKLGRPGQAGKTKSELLQNLYMISSEEEGVSELQKLDSQLQMMFPPLTKVVFRLITTIFGDNFRAEFARLNDTKKRAAFESNETFKEFFKKVSSVVIDDTATEHYLELLPCNDSFYEKDYDGYINFSNLLEAKILNEPLSVQEVQYCSEDKCRLIYKLLVKVRAKITDFMKRSGNGESNPFLFAEAAIIACEKEKPSPIPKKLIVAHTAYYFYMQCMFYPAISSSFVTSLPPHVKMMSKKRSTDELIVLCSDDDDDDDDEDDFPPRNSKNSKLGKHKQNKEAANKEKFMKAVCSSMVSMSSSYAQRNNRKEQKENIKDLQMSVARLQELERQYHNDIANSTDITHKGLLIDSLKSLQERLKKLDEELEKEKDRYKQIDENESVQDLEWCNYVTPASDRSQHMLRKKSDNQSSYTSQSNSVRTTVKFSNTKTVAHAPNVAASNSSDDESIDNNFAYKPNYSNTGSEKKIPEKVVLHENWYNPSPYGESIDLLASPQPAKNNKNDFASKDLFAAKESIDLLASPPEDD
jgi:hypothetical protein